MNKDQMKFVRDTAKTLAKKGFRGKALEQELLARMKAKFPTASIDWAKVIEFLKVILPLILALL